MYVWVMIRRVQTTAQFPAHRKQTTTENTRQGKKQKNAPCRCANLAPPPLAFGCRLVRGPPWIPVGATFVLRRCWRSPLPDPAIFTFVFHHIRLWYNRVNPLRKHLISSAQYIKRVRRDVLAMAQLSIHLSFQCWKSDLGWWRHLFSSPSSLWDDSCTCVKKAHLIIVYSESGASSLVTSVKQQHYHQIVNITLTSVEDHTWSSPIQSNASVVWSSPFSTITIVIMTLFQNLAIIEARSRSSY